MAQKIRMIRDHGQAQKYFHDLEGYNGRLDAIQAGVLRIKLKRLAGLEPVPPELPPFTTNCLRTCRHHAARGGRVRRIGLSPVRDSGRTTATDFRRSFQEKGIATGLHYPLPLHLQKAYAHLGHKKGDFPVTEHAAERLLSLPMYPELTERADRLRLFTLSENFLNRNSGIETTI